MLRGKVNEKKKKKCKGAHEQAHAQNVAKKENSCSTTLPWMNTGEERKTIVDKPTDLRSVHHASVTLLLRGLLFPFCTKWEEVVC